MNDLARRLREVHGPRYPWWDWGHRLMALVGRDDTGSWSPPRPRDLWFRKVDGKLQTTHHYADVRDNPSEDWRIFDSQNDGFEIVIGYWPAPGTHGNIHRSGIDGRDEIALFRRWMLTEWAVSEWFGLRRWLYYKGLHAAIHQRKPFTCKAVPPHGSGGYDHWHCQEPKRHAGPHRFRNYAWSDCGVEYVGAPR